MNRGVKSLIIFFCVAAVVVAVRYHEGRLKPVAVTTTSTSTPTTTSTTSPPSTSTSSTTSSTTTTTVAVAAACQGSALSASLLPGNGAAGTVYGSVVVTNHGSAPCSMNGWPTLTLYGETHAVLVSQTTDSSNYFSGNVPGAPSAFNVPVGGTAHFDVAYSDVPVGSQTSCTSADSFRVYLPGNLVTSNSVLVTASSSFAPCGQPAQLYVSPYFA